MYQRALVLALMAAGVVLPGTVRAADDCAQIFVYSVNQFCRTLSNGFSQCQPVGMVGPAPNCAKPGLPPIMPVPLAPPVVQAPMPYNFMSPFPAPGSMAPAATGKPMPAQAASAAAPIAAAKPAAPAPIAEPVAAAPSAPVAAAVPPASVVAPTPAPAPRQEPGVTPIPAPLASTPAAPTPAAPTPVKVEAAPPVAVAVPATATGAPAIVSSAPMAAAAPVAAPPAPQVQPVPVVSAPVAAASPAVEPAMPPSITLQDGLAHFGFDRAELSGQSRAELDAWLKQLLPKGKTLRVTGHADRLGPAPYNLKLSGRRAETVKKYLVGKGVAGQDIKVVAKGETVPVKHCKGSATKATIACLAPNRRVEIDPE